MKAYKICECGCHGRLIGGICEDCRTGAKKHETLPPIPPGSGYFTIRGATVLFNCPWWFAMDRLDQVRQMDETLHHDMRFMIAAVAEIQWRVFADRFVDICDALVNGGDFPQEMVTDLCWSAVHSVCRNAMDWRKWGQATIGTK